MTTEGGTNDATTLSRICISLDTHIWLYLVECCSTKELHGLCALPPPCCCQCDATTSMSVHEP